MTLTRTEIEKRYRANMSPEKLVVYKARKRQWAQQWRKSGKEPKEKVWERSLRFKYNLTLSDYQKLLETQNGRCAICGKLPGKRPLDVDHDHTTGYVRGLLCSKCNRELVPLEDPAYLTAAMAYLTKWKKIIDDYNNARQPASLIAGRIASWRT